MFVLITGGCKNGKSRLAEKILTAYDVPDMPRFYVATMEPFGNEAAEAIARHRKIREGKNFTTIEKYTDISEIKLPQDSGVLLECICNLCANEMFSANEKNPVPKIIRGIETLINYTEIFVAVTNQVGGDGVKYSPETMEYIKQMGLLNNKLAELADVVIEAVFGIPVLLKGDLPECLC